MGHAEFDLRQPFHVRDGDSVAIVYGTHDTAESRVAALALMAAACEAVDGGVILIVDQGTQRVYVIARADLT